MGLGEILGMAQGAATGHFQNVYNNAMQYGQQEDLQALGIQGAKEMALFNKDLQLQLLRDSMNVNMEEMKKLGLNVGLMYKSGNTGGTTAANTASPNIANAESNGIGLMQAALTKAQIENVEADTDKKVAEKEDINSRIPGTVADSSIKANEAQRWDDKVTKEFENLDLRNEELKIKNKYLDEKERQAIQQTGININNALKTGEGIELENAIKESTVRLRELGFDWGDNVLLRIFGPEINEAIKGVLQKYGK